MKVRRRMLSGGLGAVVCLLVALTIAPSAQANIGYEPHATKPVISVPVDLPRGISIDQSTRLIHVGGYVKSLSSQPLEGEILQLSINGTPTANSPIGAGVNLFFAGVAVNPVTHGVYAARSKGETPFGVLGEPRLHFFSSTGSELSSFSLNNTLATAPQIAADSSGRVYYPNPMTGLVEVFDSTGAPQATISCGGCPNGNFSQPAVVAIDGDDNVYVVDIGKDFVVKLKPASQSFAFERRFQTGLKAGSVGVNSVTGDVFVGDQPANESFHIVAYDSNGVQFDDFAAGMTATLPPQAGMWLTPQLAFDETTNDLFVSDGQRLLVFERTTIDLPSTAVGTASPSQLKATLSANVNANGHAVIDCRFQYVTQAAFLSTGFTGAASEPCSGKPTGTSSTAVSGAASGLTPATQYRFRVVAESNAGSTTSGDQSFTTLAANPPVITAQPATNVSQTNALLAAKVNPRGGAVSACRFEYGTSAAYGTQVPCASLPGEVSTDVSLTRDITGLTAGTTYHFRLVVTSNAGTTNGADGQFTTSAAPTVPTIPSAGGTPFSPPPTAIPTPTSTPRPLRCRKGFVKKKVRGKLRCVKKPRKRAARKRRSAR